MRWAFFQSSPDLHDPEDEPFTSGWRREKLSHRAIALGLAIAIEILFLLALLQLGPAFVGKKVAPTTTTFEMLPAEVAQKVTKVVKSGGAPPAKTPTPRTAPIIAPVVPKPLLSMSKDEFAATDISKLPNQGGNAGSGTGKGSGSAMGPGEGPGGEPMYNAEWYVEPSPNVLDQYLPRGTPPGKSWGMVACKTIEHYGVENCQQLGESPLGSGISRAMRLAAWQFKVRPPRIGGKALIGVWVRIRWDITTTTTVRQSQDTRVPDGLNGPN